MDTPATSYTDTELRDDWTDLCHRSTTAFVGARIRTGMLLLEHYQPHIWQTRGPNGRSISDLWHTDARIKAEARSLLEKRRIYKSEVRRNLAFANGVPLPTMYRPLLTKGIVAELSAKKVLDPCIGWGGRMIGSVCLNDVEYTGCEPNTLTYTGLCDMATFCNVSDRVTLYNDGAEVVLPTLVSGSYDLVLTSPPYFDLEVYTDEATQSINKWPVWEEWICHWLDPLIKECIRCLTVTGVSAWSVKNMRRYKLRDTVVAIHEKYGFELYAVRGMMSCRRKTGETASLTEETLLFRRRP